MNGLNQIDTTATKALGAPAVHSTERVLSYTKLLQQTKVYKANVCRT